MISTESPFALSTLFVAVFTFPPPSKTLRTLLQQIENRRSVKNHGGLQKGMLDLKFTDDLDFDFELKVRGDNLIGVSNYLSSC